MKAFLFSLVVLMTTQSFADDIYSCRLVDDFDDWSVSISMDREEVLFFDNDTTVTGTLSHVLERLPPIYVFSSTNPKDPWTFEFSELENEQGYLEGTLYLVEKKNKKKAFPMNCSQVQDDQDQE